jgi:hypothetical protein
MSLMSSFRHSMKLQFWSLNLLDTSALSKALRSVSNINSILQEHTSLLSMKYVKYN